MRRGPADVAAQLSILANASLGQLRRLWAEHFGGPPRFRARRELLVPMLAYRLQEVVYGGLSKASQRRLHGLAEAVGKPKRGSSRLRSAVAPPKPGTRLIREWRGDRKSVV